MPEYVVQKIDHYTEEVLDDCVDNEIFHNRAEAEEFAECCASDFDSGADYLDDAGLSFTPSDEIDFVVVER